MARHCERLVRLSPVVVEGGVELSRRQRLPVDDDVVVDVDQDAACDLGRGGVPVGRAVLTRVEGRRGWTCWRSAAGRSMGSATPLGSLVGEERRR